MANLNLTAGENITLEQDGNNLVVNSTGGGTASDDIIVISDTEPQTEDTKLWIDTGEVGESFSEITNEYSTSTGKGYSANYVNNLHTYSTNEIRVGTWIDGKPIYRKVIDLGSLPNSTYKEVATGLTNTNIRLTKIYGVAYTSTGDSQCAIGDIYTRLEVRSGNNMIRVTTTANYSAYNGYAILEYTKTTD